ncbi:cell division protein FtsW (lipid II flippase) [Nocardiopsis arvandica]|uniref:Cell division protein FtsW (Lipid II flippase) n=1 Tax=Nocardiopsis sinuspersici TaxID=501010 RepID=A0A7Y9XEW2_9ACTN|nr:FtsW/RodA/SpoVE family cell cycle protein [Nocardiopsis sinuspersici]NYH53517.1 cell division protein FtsW (lipid II flippase) [Nocardiopsis sinuspersici]
MGSPETGPDTAGAAAEVPPRRPGRRAELVLLVAALLTVAATLLSASLSVTGGLATAPLVYLGVLCAGAVGLHVALRLTAPHADPVVMPVATVLNGLGLTMVWTLQMTGFDPGHGDADRQLLWTGTGMVLCAATVVLVRRPWRLSMYTYLIATAALLLLLLPLTPLGHEVLGARRWILLGPFSMQPSEFAKVLLVVFLASYLGRRREVMALVTRTVRIGRLKVFSVPRARDLAPMAVGWGMAILLLVGTKDLGTSLLLFATFLAVLYAATARKSWVLIGLVAFAGGAYAAYLLFAHVRNRVEIWLNAFDPDVYGRPGGSFQIVEGMFALAGGGLTGTGFGDGFVQEVFAADSDLVLVSVGEKLGLTGLLAVLLLLFLLAERGFRISLEARDWFLKLTALGYAFLTAFNVFIVLGGATLIIPLTGMTTPFLSAGGSALTANWVIVGLWLAISESARRPQEASGSGPAPDDPSTEVIRLREPPEPPRRRRED